MKSILLALLIVSVAGRAAETDTETACRAHLKLLRAAVRASRLIHDGKDPAKLSDLYLDGLVESLGDFVCPAGKTVISTASDIDANADYSLVPVPGNNDVLVHEKSPRHDPSTVLAVFGDGSIKLIPAPDRPVPTAPAPMPTPTPAPAVVVVPPSVQPAPADAEPAEYQRAHALYLAGHYVEALPEYNAAVARAPGHRASQFERATVRLWLNDVRGALGDWTALGARNPNDTESRRLRASLELIVGQPAAGLTEAEALAKSAPNFAPFVYVRAQAELWNNRTDDGRASLARVQQLDPGLASRTYDQAWALLKAGVVAPAYLEFSTLTWTQPQPSGALYGMGVAAERLGFKERAIQAFERFLQADPNGPNAATARAELQRLQH